MAIVTNAGHTNRAIDWYNKCKNGEVWFCIGGQAEWPDEAVPPAETEDDTITDVICYKKVEQYLYVKQSDTGSIYYHGHNYEIVPEDQLYSEKCRWVLCNVFLNYDECPVGVGYRKIGVATNIVPIAGKEDSYILLPGDLQSEGHVDVIANDTVTIRSATKREKLQILCEF